VFLQRIEDHFIERENPLQAIETLHQVIGQSGDEVLPRFFLGRLYYRLEMHDEAYRALKGLEERVRTSQTYHYLMGRIHERRGEVKLALDRYRRSLREAGVRQAEFVCGPCGARTAEWVDRCEVCGRWNAVELDFREERLSPEALGIHERPVWAVDDSDLQA
jgi:hypothetical protein